MSRLQESLEAYVRGELLEGADAYHCDKCNKKVRFIKYYNTNMILFSDCLHISIIVYFPGRDGETLMSEQTTSSISYTIEKIRV